MPNDDDMWRDLKSGSSEALTSIYDKYIDSLFAYGRHFIKEDTILQDCIQDVFVEIWVKRDRLSDTNNINFYLLKCLKRRIFKVVKKNQKENASYHISDYFQDFSEEGDVKNPEIFDKLQNALESLNPNQKKILILKFYNQLSTEEIGDILEMTKKQVYNNTAIAFDKLRKILLISVVAILLGL